jgi:adenine/guanine phosphoribosyltransferase-like PRPP-binding protein
VGRGREAHSDRIYFREKSNVIIGVEGAGFPVTMLIAERLPVPLILGRDFIRESGAQINGRTGWVTSKTNW